VKALVIGGTGFVGMNVARALVQAGHDTAATRRPRSNTLFARKLGARLVCADMADEDSLTEVMRGREVVFMCAGHYPRYSLELDVEVAHARKIAACTINAALRARVQRYVLTSSVATVGPPRDRRKLSNETDPVDPKARECVYHAVKIAIEQEVLAARNRGLDVVVLCPTGIMGPLDVKAGTGFVVVALGNGMMPLYVDGRTNIVDAEDMAVGHVAAAERGRTGERYILAGQNTSVRELLEVIADELQVPLHAWRIPSRIAAVLSTVDEMRCASKGGAARPFLAREFVDIVRFGLWVDASKASRDLGWTFETPLLKTVRNACSWYQRHRYLKARQPGLQTA
jgi:dihydroflavonol-4-reductase